jgi:hypothetical protein
MTGIVDSVWHRLRMVTGWWEYQVRVSTTIEVLPMGEGENSIAGQQ